MKNEFDSDPNGTELFGGSDRASLAPLTPKSKCNAACCIGRTILKLYRLRCLLLVSCLLSFSAWAEPSSVTVALTPAAQLMVRQASSSEKNALQRAIKTGNKFIKLRFLNEDGYDIETEGEWKKTVGPLMAMSGEDWRRISEQWITTVKKTIQGKETSGVLLVCPRVELVEIRGASDGITLTYRATLIGASFDLWAGRIRYFVDTSRQGQPYQVAIKIGKQDRIAEVTSPEKALAWIYFYHKDSIKRDIEIGVHQNDLESVKLGRDQLKTIDAAASICNSQK